MTRANNLGPHDGSIMPRRYTLCVMFQSRSIRHCRACGGEVTYRVPADDNRERAVCARCATVHYENPVNVVGTVPAWEERILLCRRNIEPRYGLWTLPAGFMEIGETTETGALRETEEEAGARVELPALHFIPKQPSGKHYLYLHRRGKHVDAGPGEPFLDWGPRTGYREQ